jgi:hypothetical protein
MRRTQHFLIFILVFLAFHVQSFGGESTDLLIGSSRQFFFDTIIVESIRNVTRVVHSPDKAAGPIIKSDKPWEKVTYFTCNAWNVIKDPQDGLFKCWYEDWHFSPERYAKKFGMVSKEQFSRYCYAVSGDGLTWEKPKLDFIEEDGQKTNIVLGGERFGSVHAAFIFLDSLETDPEKRYKGLYALDGVNAYTIVTSPDGIHWQRSEQTPVFGREGRDLGDVITVALDMNSRTYLANNRHKNMIGGGMIRSSFYRSRPYSFIHEVYLDQPYKQNRRRLFRSVSSDLVHWSTPELLLAPDPELDNWDDVFYGMVQIHSGGMWIGFLNVFHMTENTMDVQLIYSRNGKDFKRIRPGQPWLERGGPGSWDEFMVNIPNPPVRVGDDLYVYHGGAQNHHDWWITGVREGLDVPEVKDFSNVSYGLGLAKMKVDRFVSMRALDVREGVLITKPFRTDGQHLVINAKCHENGSITAEVTDASGVPLTGFEQENCRSFKGDQTDHQVQWRSDKSIPTGEFIKLRFFINNADLFTFEFEE